MSQGSERLTRCTRSCRSSRNGTEYPSEGFIDYYENHHGPLILGLAPAPDVCKRHCVVRGDELNLREDGIDFDVVTEVAFADSASCHRWLQTLGEAGSLVPDDEARFLERSRHLSFTDDERVTFP